MFELSFVQNIFAYNLLGFNWTDLIILVIIGFYVFEGYQLGFTLAFLDFVSFILSFIVALRFYGSIASILSNVFALPIGLGNALGFCLLAFIVEVISNIVFHHIVYPRLPRPKNPPHAVMYQKVDHWLGILPGFISACIIIAFALTLIVALPVSPFLKSMVSSSQIGSRIVDSTTNFEGKLNSIFGGALQETMSYLTIEPKSNESIKLHFTVKNGTIDQQAEIAMFRMVNQQRTSRGIPALADQPALTHLAEAYANNMFVNGYFSHYDQRGASPFDRMQAVGITYTAAGENLALAPNVELAMQGLMNSPGHKANILSTSFHKVGIGVIDGGIYGEMFAQEFTN